MGCHAPAPGRRSEGLPRCDYRGRGSLASNPCPQANPLTEVVREVLTSSRTANAFCTPCAGASASDVHWLGYCASLMLSFLPTRTARSTNIKEKDSDVVTDGTVGWRRRKIFCLQPLRSTKLHHSKRHRPQKLRPFHLWQRGDPAHFISRTLYRSVGDPIRCIPRRLFRPQRLHSFNGVEVSCVPCVHFEGFEANNQTLRK